MITPWETGEEVPFNVDAWDGYTADRTELLGHIQDKEIDNVVFLTGDIHTSWANDVPIDDNTYPVTPSVAVEMVGPSVTSDNLDDITGSPARTTSLLLEQEVKADNPWVKYVELDTHGYSDRRRHEGAAERRLVLHLGSHRSRRDPVVRGDLQDGRRARTLVSAGDGPV